MVDSCCAPGCTNNRAKNKDKSFYRIPKDPERRNKWLSAIKRVRSKTKQTETRWDPPASGLRLCSDHFVAGKKSENPLSPDFIPSIFHYMTSPEKNRRRMILELFKKRQRTKLQKLSASAVLPSNFVEEEVPPESDWIAPPHPEHDYAVLPLPVEEQLEEAHKTISEQAELTAQPRNKQFLLSRFQDDCIEMDGPLVACSDARAQWVDPALEDHDYARPCRTFQNSSTVDPELHFCTPLSSCKMQAGVCLRADTKTTLPELTEQHRICLKEEERSGLESVHMAESETKFAALGLSTLEPECVSAHCRVSNAYHSDTSLIKTETDLGPAHTEELKVESLNSSELGYATHLHPDQIKTETDDEGYLKAECISDLQDIKCVVIKYEDMKCESSESLVDLMNIEKNGAEFDHEIKTEPCQYAGESSETVHTEKNGAEFDHEIETEPCQYAGESSETVHTEKNGAEFDHEIKTEPCQYAGESSETVHADEKPYKCTLCGKSFNSKCNLNSHHRIHTGEKPYKCTQCGKCYRYQSHLNTHQRIHTGEKRFKCPHCGKCFPYQFQLNTHQRIHARQKSPINVSRQRVK